MASSDGSVEGQQRQGGEQPDAEAPEADVVEQRQAGEEEVQEWPRAAPPAEVSEADAIEQQEEVPPDDEYRP